MTFGWYKHGEEHGSIRSILPNGTLVSCIYRDGEKDGVETRTLPDGNVSETTWRRGSIIA